MAAALDVAFSLGGSLADEEAGPYLESLWTRFSGLGTQTDEKAWLESSLSEAFQSVEQPPNWIESDPAWAFHNGFPMVFITHMKLEENAVTSARLGYDQTIYFFGARQEVPGGFELVYKTVTQIEGF